MKQLVEKSYVGLDISKDFIDVCILPQQDKFRISNDNQGFQSLIQSLPQSVQRIILEHTSKYGRAVIHALQAKHFPVCPINPRQIRRFAQALGLLAKTDKIDSFVCAQFAKTMEIKPASPIDPARQQLADLETTRKQFVDDIVRYKNRIHGAEKTLQIMYRSIIAQIEKQLDKIHQEIKRLIKQNPSWQAIVDLLLTVKGIGETTAYLLFAKLPELGTISHQAIAALVGVAPFNRDSGYYRGKRQTRGGRKPVRDGMHMATLVATRHNPVIRDFYQHLLSKGKLKKVALIACQRKLIVILNAKVRDLLAHPVN